MELGHCVQQITLINGSADDIAWKWTAMESTHQKAQTDLAQFYGQMVNANFIPLWQSHAEPKHRFFE